jgi:hypothetical protein
MASNAPKLGFYNDLVWRLVSRDDGSIVEGQFEPNNLRKALSARYAEARTLGRFTPILMFEDNTVESYSFVVRVWAQHEGTLPLLGVVGGGGIAPDTVEDLVAAIEGLVRPDPRFGRPMIYDFTVGSVVALTCVVSEIGPVSFDKLRPSRGDFRGATFELTLLKYEEYDISLQSSLTESLVQPFLSNDSFESMAFRAYGNPNAGEPLRRRNPGLVNPNVGDLLHLPPEPLLLTGFEFEPQAPALAFSDEQDAVRRDHFKLRGKDRVSFSLGPLWDKAV